KHYCKILTGLFIDSLFLGVWYLIHYGYKLTGNYFKVSERSSYDSFSFCYTGVQWLLDITIIIAILRFVFDDVKKLWKQPV
ncbi:MAG TPA: hypothetical protein VGN95_19260, partial [Pyrinomonadaceae bacterium]|nr:hypothetical protein [Pyrinomonadaceae bacterium]